MTVGLLPGASSGFIAHAVAIEHELGVDSTPHHRNHRDPGSQVGPQTLLDGAEGHGVDTVGAADEHQIGSLQLVGEELLDRRDVIKAGIRLALGLHRSGVSDHMAEGQGLTVHHGHHRMDSGTGADLGPAEGCDQGLRQGQTTGLDHDAVETIRSFEQLIEGGEKFILDRAAEAAVGQLHQATLQVLPFAEAAAGDQITVDAHLAELVDDHRQTLTPMGEKMAQKRGLAGPQEAGHHRHRKPAWFCGLHLSHQARPGPGGTATDQKGRGKTTMLA